MIGHTSVSRILPVLVAGACLLVGCTDDSAGPESGDVDSIESIAPPMVSAAMRAEGYVAALNAADPEQMFRFYVDNVTEGFREQRTEADDRAFYLRLTGDLGQLRIEQVLMESPDRVTVTAYSARMDMPVELEFAVEDDRIAGVGVRIGGSPGAKAAIAVELPEGISAPELADALDLQLGAFAAEDRFSGVVLLARDGEPFFHEAYGLADREAGIANTTGTAFDVGSITKFMTRTAVAQLLQDGRLTLDGRIVDYLPDYPNSEVANAVTVQQLLDHSSGLGDVFNERWEAAAKERYVEPRDFFALFADQPLLFEPGTSRAYSNAGFIVLGAIVEAVSGQDFAEYLTTRIFAPAGMTSSGLMRRARGNQGQALGYAPLGAGGTLTDTLGMLPVAGCPAGSSMHTATDLLKLDVALRRGELLDPEWTAWVYGSETVQDDAGYAIGIAGGAPGVSTGLESDGRLAVIVLSNFDPPTGEVLALKLYQQLH